MDLYTLTSDFFPMEMVHDFTSAIWTERYSSAGDMQIVVPADLNQIAQFAPGTPVGLQGTREIMLVETQSIDGGMLTVTGSSLPKFLNQREAFFENPAYGTVLLSDGSIDTSVPLFADRVDAATTAGQLISSVVNQMVIAPVPFGSYWAPINLDWADDRIPGLTLGMVDTIGTPTQMTFSLGPLYDTIAKLATDYGVGFKLYLASSTYSTHSYVLKFATYRGRNRTSNQSTFRLVRLSALLDSLNNPKELNSISKYKNIVYVTYKGSVTVHYDKYTGSVPAGFNRRVLRVDAPDIYLTPDHIPPFRDAVARNTFIDNPYVLSVDGQVPTKIPYVFGKDYDLGDIVELEGPTGLLYNVRVTEYIRSQDQYGEKAFPTLAAIDPLKTGYFPDTQPSPDWNSDWNFNPDFNLDDLNLDDLNLNPILRNKLIKPTPTTTNPDPIPNFGGWPGPSTSGGGPSDSTEFPTGAFLAVGFYPDQNNGEKVGFVRFGDQTLLPVWTQYTSEDPDGGTYWVDIYPKFWTPDQQLVLFVDEYKSSTDAYPWSTGYSWWRIGNGTDHIRLTETLAYINRPDGSGGYYMYSNQAFWAGIIGNMHWYVDRQYGQTEYLYADGTYSTDPTLHDSTVVGGVLIRSHPLIDDPGPILTNGQPHDIYHNTSGHVADFSQLLGVGAFSGKSRWAPSNIKPAPNGSKLLISRNSFAPGVGDHASWRLDPGVNPWPTTGTYRIMFGKYGSYLGGIYTFPISVTATPEEIWIALITAQTEEWTGPPILDDPRNYGYPYDPWSAPGYQITLTYKVLADEGVWMDIDNHDLIDELWLPMEIQPNGVYPDGGHSHLYLANLDGSGLTEIDFGGIKLSTGPIWSTNSAKLHGVAQSATGKDYCRWFVYDVASGTVTFPLDYSSADGPYVGYGPLLNIPLLSPNGTKVVWQLAHSDGSVELLVGNADGSGATTLYTQTSSMAQDDQSVIFLGPQIAWNSLSTKIAVVDSRGQAPIWVIDIATGTQTKVFAGTGWTDSSQEKWIYDPMVFNG